VNITINLAIGKNKKDTKIEDNAKIRIIPIKGIITILAKIEIKDIL
jgi:hypothetical protein